MKNTLFLIMLLMGSLLLPNKAQAQTPTDKQLQSIEKYMAPLRKKVTDILEADKTGQYQTYKADLERISKESDPARRDELLTNLERKHYQFIKNSYERAVINHEEMRREIARILGHSNFTLGAFGDLQIDFTTPGLTIPLRFDAEFTCPMGAKDESNNSQIVADCYAQARDCYATVQAIAEVAGGCRGKASVGDKFDLTDGPYTKITAVVQSDISYDGIAIALVGYSQINAKYGIRFRGLNLDKTVFTKEVFALAPLVWFARLRGSADNFVSQATFTGNFPQGSAVTAQAYLEGFALAVPIGSLTWIDTFIGNIDFVRLSGSN